MSQPLDRISPRARLCFDHLYAVDVEHSSRTLREHLVGTFNILTRWDVVEDVRLAGLFHSAYGTASFRHATLSVEQRALLRDAIGDRAELLVFAYANCDRTSFLTHEASRNADDRNTAEGPAHSGEWRASFSGILAILAADAVEQIPRRGLNQASDSSRFHLTREGVFRMRELATVLLPCALTDLNGTLDLGIDYVV